jgi:alpha-L-fucosidase 2
MSPYMSIYPVGLLSVEDPGQKSLIGRSLRHIEKTGTREWCGYSFSWMSCLYARGHEGDSAASMLRHFATNFCSINSFHLNGDQKGGQYSSFTYRPFTLEGNFAFAQGVQEMLIQSYQGYIEVFPALPAAWKNVSFSTLRTEGAFLVSAKKEQGIVKEVTLRAVAGGELRLKLPFPTWYVLGTERNNVTIENGVAVVKTLPGQVLTFKNGYE